MPKIHVLNEGDSNCLHTHVFYIDNAFDGQAWWCDICPRHEKIDYSPGEKILFPPLALISTPNPEYGGEEVYTFRANKEGRVTKKDILFPEQRILRKDIGKGLAERL